MRYPEIHSCAELTAFIDEIGFLPLLRMGVDSWSSEEFVDDDCQYTPLPSAGWEWSLVDWNGDVLLQYGFAVVEFLRGQSCLVSSVCVRDLCIFCC